MASLRSVLVPPVAFLNGKFLPLSEAQVPVLDRGFLFGDGVYEVIPAYGGRLFRISEHLKRLETSLSAIRCANPYSWEQWTDLLQDLVTQNGAGDLSVYLQITRGVGPNRDHAFPENSKPTVFAMATPLASLEKYQKGVSAILVEDIRWARCDVKSITLLANILLRQQAIDVGAFEAILVRDEQVIEGAASNVFIVREGMLITPPKGSMLLPGITRDLVLELASEYGMSAREAPISVQELRTAEEVWLTSSTREIVPVIALDGNTAGNGKPGLWHKRMVLLYQGFKSQARAGTYG
ncbi:D-alanine aminotransferase [Gammaproteobacteria bacterium]